MKVTVYRQPCMLHEATELVHAFVNQTPVEQLASPEKYGIPAEEVLRIRAVACEGLNPDSEEMQFFFHGIPFEDKGEDVSSIARYMVYSLASDIIPDVDEMVAYLLRDWKNTMGTLRVINMSNLGLGTMPDETGAFHSLTKEISRLPIPVVNQMQMIEMLSNFEFYLHRLVKLLRPVIEKLEVLLKPWVQRTEPLLESWQTYFSDEENVRQFIMETMAIDVNQIEELRICPRYLQPNSGYACITKAFKVFNVYHGIGKDFSVDKPRRLRQTLESEDYMVLRQLGNADRMSMLLAMMSSPMTAQEVSQKLELHSGSVFRDLNSMSNANLLIREVLGGKRIYRTNYPVIRDLFRKILQALEKEAGG